jgi:protein-disulfide isomerase
MRRTIFHSLAAAVLVAGGVIALAAVTPASAAPAESTAAPATAAPPAGAADTTAESKDQGKVTLMSPGPLPREALGDPKAPVTVIEYASLTCPHCAHFDETTFPVLKKDYIDAGKVYYIFREFPLDNFATAGFMLARCVPQGQYFAVVHAFFKSQPELDAAPDPLKWLEGFAKQIGLTPEQTHACLTNQKLLDAVMAVRQRAAEKFGVDATPTFFIDGKKYPGAMEPDELRKVLDPLLKKS